MEIYVSDTGVHLIDSVRNPEKKAVMALVQEDMEEQLHEIGIPIIDRAPDITELRRRFHNGAIPLALISSWQINEARVPHWVVVTGFDDHFVYIHDPFVDEKKGETVTDSINIPISFEMFERMTSYGRRGLRAVVLVSRKAAA